jgi:hypothetical protein
MNRDFILHPSSFILLKRRRVRGLPVRRTVGDVVAPQTGTSVPGPRSVESGAGDSVCPLPNPPCRKAKMEPEQRTILYGLDERTLEWQNKTQAIRRASVTRGGQVTDYRARRHTTAGIAAIGLLLLALIAAMPRLRPAAPSRVTAPSPMTPVDRTAFAADVPVPAVRQTAPVRSSPQSPDIAWMEMSLPGHVPPPAPVWIDGPRRTTEMSFPAGAFAVTQPPAHQQNLFAIR